jgi:hypothetical protein
MIRHLATVLFALSLAAPAFLQAQQTQVEVDPPALRLMNNTEFNLFLKSLDTDAMRWKARLRTVDVASLGIEDEEGKEIERSYTRCLQSLDNTREEIQKLSQRQTLKLDFLLLVELNGLARSLDRLSSNLASPVTTQEPGAAKKSLGWAREVLDIDEALAPHIAEFQQHVLALAGLLDAALERAEQKGDQSQNQK